jgi:hypothetical protein
MMDHEWQAERAKLTPEQRDFADKLLQRVRPMILERAYAVDVRIASVESRLSAQGDKISAAQHDINRLVGQLENLEQRLRAALEGKERTCGNE